MDNLNQYALVGDDCESCRYINNAFMLLKLPLKNLTVAQVEANSDCLSHTIAAMICPLIQSTHTDQLIKIKHHLNEFSLILFSDSAEPCQFSDTKPIHMAMPFSIYQLKQALSQSRNRDFDISRIDLNDPIFDVLVGQSAQMSKIKAMIHQVASCDSNVLILGQSGTGKDVIATCIHYLSNRKMQPLVPINCGAIPSELMESELFGHEKGAFTGALTRRAGRFEMANTGTLFLDEIGDMPLPMQVKLLRVIQERKIERVGGNATIDVDVRLIAATNKNLADLITQNRFREDLFYRLNVFPINVPNLNERADDIPLLIEHHLDKIYNRLHHRVVFTENALDILCKYSWPGNIRELANFLERMVILHRDCVLDENDLDSVYKQANDKKVSHTIELPVEAPFNIKEYIANIEQQMIKIALERSNGIVSAAAEYLSLGRTTLIEKIKKYNLLYSKS